MMNEAEFTALLPNGTESKDELSYRLRLLLRALFDKITYLEDLTKLDAEMSAQMSFEQFKAEEHTKEQTKKEAEKKRWR